MVIQAIRDNVPKWITAVILALLVGPFALWGINSYFTASTDNSVAKVNGDEVTPADFQRAYQSQYARLQQMFGANFKPGMIDERQLRAQTLDHLIGETLLNQQAVSQHYAISNAQLVEDVQKMAAFQVDGKFSPQVYRSTLEASGLSPVAFEQRYRQSLSVQQLQEALQDSAIATPAELAASVAVRDQQREVAYLTLPASRFLDAVTVSDADITAYYKAHEKEFMTPEKVTLAYVELDEANLAKDVQADDASLKALYQQQLSSYQQAEARQARHILFAVSGNDPKADAAAKAQAEDVLKQLKAGGDFAKLAARYSQDPGSAKNGGDLGMVEHGVMVKPFEDALFAIKQPGDIAGPVRTQFGYHLIQLESVRAPTVKPFDEVKAGLATDYQKKKADDEYYNLGDQLANLAYEHPDSLGPVSQQLKLPIGTVVDVTRDAGTGIAANEEVRKTAFSDALLTQGDNSEPIQLGPNHAVVIRVQGHVTSEAEPLTLVRDRIVATLKQQHAQQAAAQKADELINDIGKGGDPVALAKSAGASFTAARFLGRNENGVPPALLAAVFAAPAPTGGRSLKAVTLDNGDQAVMILSAAKPGDVSALTDTQRTTALQDLSREDGAKDFAAYLANLRAQAKVSINSKNMESQGE